MNRSSVAGRPMVGAAAGLALGFVVLAGGADGGAGANPTLDAAPERAEAFGKEAAGLVSPDPAGRPRHLGRAGGLRRAGPAGPGRADAGAPPPAGHARAAS